MKLTKEELLAEYDDVITWMALLMKDDPDNNELFVQHLELESERRSVERMFNNALEIKGLIDKK